MAAEDVVAVVPFQCPATATTLDITSPRLSGLTVDAMLVFVGHGTTDGVRRSHIAYSAGVSDLTASYCWGCFFKDNDNGGDVAAISQNGEIIALPVTTGATTRETLATVDSAITDGVRLSFSAVSGDREWGFAVLFAGWANASLDLSANLTLNNAVTVTTGFQPDLVISLCQHLNPSVDSQSTTIMPGVGVGFADGTKQYVAYSASDEASRPRNWAYLANNTGVAAYAADGANTFTSFSVAIDNFTATGYDLTQTGEIFALNQGLPCLALKATSANIDIRAVQTPANTNNWSPVTGLGWEPDAALMFFTGNTQVNNPQQDGNTGSLSFSGFDPDHQVCLQFGCEDNVTTSNATSLYLDQALSIWSDDQATEQYRANHLSFDAGGFTLDGVTQSGSQKWGLAVTFEKRAGGTSQSYSIGGAVTVSASASAALAHEQNFAITGDGALSLLSAADTARGRTRQGAAPVSWVPAGESSRGRTRLGDGPVSLLSAADTALGRSRQGDVPLGLLPTAATSRGLVVQGSAAAVWSPDFDGSLGRGISGAIPVGTVISAALAKALHPELTGAAPIVINPAAATARARALSGAAALSWLPSADRARGYDVAGTIGLALIPTAGLVYGAAAGIAGAVTWAPLPAAAFTLGRSITGAGLLGLLPAAETSLTRRHSGAGLWALAAASGLSITRSLTGAGVLAMVPIAVLDRRRHPVTMGDVTLAVAVGAETSRGRDMAGAGLLTALPSAGLFFGSAQGILGAVQAGFSPAAVTTIGRSMTGATAAEIVPAALLAGGQHPALAGTVPWQGDSAAALAFARHWRAAGEVPWVNESSAGLVFARHPRVAGDVALMVAPDGVAAVARVIDGALVVLPATTAELVYRAFIGAPIGEILRGGGAVSLLTAGGSRAILTGRSTDSELRGGGSAPPLTGGGDETDLTGRQREKRKNGHHGAGHRCLSGQPDGLHHPAGAGRRHGPDRRSHGGALGALRQTGGQCRAGRGADLGL